MQADRLYELIDRIPKGKRDDYDVIIRFPDGREAIALQPSVDRNEQIVYIEAKFADKS